jgi:hypothetical protein
MILTHNPGRVAGFLYLRLSINGPIKLKTSPRGHQFRASRWRGRAPCPDSYGQPKKSSALEFLEGYKVWSWSQLKQKFRHRPLEKTADYLRDRTQG